MLQRLPPPESADADLGRFYANDPVGYVSQNPIQSFNRYAYGNNNPYKFVDPDGRIVETVWDVANIGIGVGSLGYNLWNGNFGDAAWDVGGLALDIGATVVPFVPGGAATALKVKRAKNALSKCCFVAGTLVKTQIDGKSTYIAIEKLKEGDLVWSRSEDGLEEDWKPVTKTWIKTDRLVWGLVLEIDGVEQLLETTDDHPFAVIVDSDGVEFVETQNLKAGDLIYTAGDRIAKVVSVENTLVNQVTYNITVADYYSYFVSEYDVWVHNVGCDIAIKLGANAKKIRGDQLDMIGEILDAGPNWHKTQAKTKFLNRFKKELKGSKNADFYVDKKTKEVLLKGNQSKAWAQTGIFL